MVSLHDASSSINGVSAYQMLLQGSTTDGYPHVPPSRWTGGVVVSCHGLDSFRESFMTCFPILVHMNDNDVSVLHEWAGVNVDTTENSDPSSAG